MESTRRERIATGCLAGILAGILASPHLQIDKLDPRKPEDFVRDAALLALMFADELVKQLERGDA